MASMDNLRDKIRSRRADTSDLETASNSAPTAALAQNHDDFTAAAGQENSFSSGNTDSLISEIFADEPYTAPAFHEKPEPKSKPPAEPKPKKPLNFPLLERFKQLEINRRMLLISVGVAALATVLAMFYIKGIADPLQRDSKMLKVITVTEDIPAGTKLTEKMVQIKEVPALFVPETAEVYEPNLPLLGKVTTTTLYKGEMLNKQRTILPEDVGMIDIPKGHRAIQVKTDSAGLIKPSTHDRKQYVDLIANIPDPDPGRKGKVIPYPVLQRALVLAVGDQVGDAAPKSNTFSSASSNKITVAVPEERLNLMVMLEDKTEFKVIPRAPDDESTQMEKYTLQEIEDMLQGKIESPTPARNTSDTPSSAPAKPAAAPAALSNAHGPDLSGGSSRSYSAPAYRAPARSYSAPTYHAPARSYSAPRSAPRAAAPKPAAPRAAAPAPASRPRVTMPRMTIQGGAVTQSAH